jgi:hypothetical protein
MYKPLPPKESTAAASTPATTPQVGGKRTVPQALEIIENKIQALADGDTRVL